MSELIAAEAERARDAFQHHQIRDQSDRSWLLQRPYWGPPEKKRYMTRADSVGAPTGWESVYSTEIICGRHQDLIVNGDIALVVFAYGPRDPRERVRWMGRRHIGDYVDGYLMEKATIGMGRGDFVRRFDMRAAREDIAGWLRDAQQQHVCGGEPGCDCIVCKLTEVLDELDDINVHLGSHEGLVHHLYERLGPRFMEDRYPVGLMPASRVFYAHAALRRLCDIWDS